MADIPPPEPRFPFLIMTNITNLESIIGSAWKSLIMMMKYDFDKELSNLTPPLTWVEATFGVQPDV